MAATSGQKSSFAQLSNPSGGYGITSATDKNSTVGLGNYSNNTQNEYICLAWQNMASITSARKISREANKKAKQYYTFTFIDNLDEEKEAGDISEDDVELDEDESAYNSKFSFDDDEEAWLGTRKKCNVEDIINNNDEKTSEDYNIDLQTKPPPSKQNVIGVFKLQVQAPSPITNPKPL